VLFNYIEKNEKIPYEDLQYLYGEIMYGGHITDHWDRRTNAAYLKKYMRASYMEDEQAVILAGQKKPNTTKSQYEDYVKWVDEKLDKDKESPLLFGLHSNAEINYLTIAGNGLFSTILEV
jgi:dynein heavy chain